jgi:hypothetical protein
MKLVTGAGQSSEPHAFEAMVDFEMGETHLDTLRSSRDMRNVWFPSTGVPDRCVLVDVTRNMPRRRVGTTQAPISFSSPFVDSEMAGTGARSRCLSHITNV